MQSYPSEYEVSAPHTNPHAQSANAGTFGQCVTTQRHPAQACQTLTMKRKSNYPPRLQKKDVDSARDHQPFKKSYSISLGTLDPDDIKEELFVTQIFK